MNNEEKKIFAIMRKNYTYLKANLQVDARLMISLSSKKIKTRHKGLNEWLIKARRRL
jgi:hypothetical protein